MAATSKIEIPDLSIVPVQDQIYDTLFNFIIQCINRVSESDKSIQSIKDEVENIMCFLDINQISFPLSETRKYKLAPYRSDKTLQITKDFEDKIYNFLKTCIIEDKERRVKNFIFDLNMEYKITFPLTQGHVMTFISNKISSEIIKFHNEGRFHEHILTRNIMDIIYKYHKLK